MAKKNTPAKKEKKGNNVFDDQLQEVLGRVKKEDVRLGKLFEQMAESNGKSMRKMMIQAGYSEHYADYPSKIRNTKAYKEKSADFLAQLGELKQNAIKRMKETVDEATYRDVSHSLKDLDNMERLTTGQSTENVASIVRFNVPQEEDETKKLEE